MSSVAVARTIRTVLADAVAMLDAAGVPAPRADAEWLLAGTLGVGRARLGLDANRPLTPRESAAFDAAVRRRAQREPLQQVLGWEEFCGLRLRVTPDVLVPRPETEMLVEWARALLPRVPGRRLRVADVGTGSGCVACALAAVRDDLDVLAIDASAAAARVAAGNVRALALAPRVVVADCLGPVRTGSLDAVVANPPYLTGAEMRGLPPEIARHEPRLALDGGHDGLALLSVLADEGMRVLRPGGHLVVETGGPAHVAAMGARLQALGYDAVRSRADLAGVPRFVTARAPGERAA